MTRSPICCAVLLAITGHATGQNTLIQEDFDSIPIGTPITTLPGWSDQSAPGFPRVLIESNPCNLSNAILLDRVVEVAERELTGLPAHTPFILSFDIAIWSEVTVSIRCPNIITGPDIIDDVRDLVSGDSVGTLPIISSGGQSAPLTLGACKRLVLDVDPLGDVHVTYDGQPLAVFPWASTSTFSTSTEPIELLVRTRGSHKNDTPAVLIDRLSLTSSYASTCPSPTNSTGGSAVMTGSGSSSLVANNLSLTINHLPPHQLAYVLVASNPDYVPVVSGALGPLCIGGTFGLALTHALSDSTGRFSGFVDLHGMPGLSSSPPITPMIGEHWYFQGLFRDTFQGGGIAVLTNALEIEILP